MANRREQAQKGYAGRSEAYRFDKRSEYHERARLEETVEDNLAAWGYDDVEGVLEDEQH